ncbi:glycoside hydrolase family 43 protein [Marinilactibacillus sp. XAAS-LB27]|uniref:glycoside hydrolase family 43 protein n=1 Tax=Marinilactibacillus sp. XAAS-LB27 TaxID=3114538 RepID=UPI002E17E220|nr:glycoside hydrolase family 43 protein [Marinilactibacillus sp. XAAS-LB27]
MKQTIQNPILKGFNPDPSVTEANGKYYIAVSSFEWLPGVRVYCSEDLVNWTHETDILTNQCDLRGNPLNCSIWAPQISFSEGTFYLVYTDVKSTNRPFKDCRNYLITATDINGPWSEPIYLNGSGFDPSLYHDEDGRKWILNALWDYRMTTSNKSSGIVLQEYDPVKKHLTGDFKKIFDCTHLKKTEAPHIYKLGAYYYLITAEGGTGINHSVTVARSKNIEGPYEVDPHFPMMTSSDHPDWPLQQSGHGSLIKTKEDEWYMVHLATRLIDGKYPILGRETSIQKVYWDNSDWLRLEHGGKLPAVQVPVPEKYTGEVEQSTSRLFKDVFDSEKLNKEWNTLRIPADESWLSQKVHSGKLHMKSGESLQSLFDQHMIGKRQENFEFTAETSMDFEPKHYMQMAGMALYLSAETYLYAYVTYDEHSGKVLRMMQSVEGSFQLLEDIVELPENESVKLRVEVDQVRAQFYYQTADDSEPQAFSSDKDISFLSGGYTGNFITLSCQDMNQFQGCSADFDYFVYEGKD